MDLTFCLTKLSWRKSTLTVELWQILQTHSLFILETFFFSTSCSTNPIPTFLSLSWKVLKCIVSNVWFNVQHNICHFKTKVILKSTGQLYTTNTRAKLSKLGSKYLSQQIYSAVTRLLVKFIKSHHKNTTM